MKVMEKNMMRLVAVQHLRAAYGIKTKNWNKNKAVSCKTAASNSTKVFGVSLETLPYYNMECGTVPRFLVDACMMLLAHVDTEGLFRKSGSVIRLKALRAKLDAGEECLSTALPCDIAGLVKQFFRELPEPVLPSELEEAFLKAQQLPTELDRTSATMLLSSVLPEKNLSTLRHFLDFLHNVSMRSAENKMDSSNLSVILAPNILHSGDGTEKMNAHTEKRLKQQAAIVHCFIENAHNFGVLPQFLLEKVPAMMGCEGGVLSPSHDGLEELDLNSGMKKKLRRSFGDMVNGALNKIKTNRTPTNSNQSDSLVFSSATPVIATPSSKRKLPLESGHSFGFSNKKRRSVKKTLGIDLFPNTLFSATSTPGSAYSASGVLDSPNNPSSAGKSRRQPAVSVRRKSRRISNRHAVNRVESGRAGCFSPKVSKKEAPRKSLRLRFNLGKSSKEAVSESVGWRLATQESTTSFRFTEETEFSPAALPREAESKSTKFISKSEDNLLTPQCDSSVHQTSWSRETPRGAQAFRGGSFTDTPMNMCLKNNYNSEPAIVVSKPPAVSVFPKKLCCASSAESEISLTESQTAPTLLKIQKAFTKSGSDLQRPCTSVGTHTTKTLDSLLPPPETPPAKVLPVDTCASSFPAQQSFLAYDQNITFGQLEMAALSPLHIDSVLFECGVYRTPAAQADAGSFCAAAISSLNSSTVGESDAEVEQVNCSRLVDALDIQSPAHFKLCVPSGAQSTPYRLGLEFRDEFSTPPKIGTKLRAVQNKCSSESGAEKQQPLSPRSLETEKRRVADHIHHFNKLTLHSPKGALAKLVRSPLQFKRTPVRQTVRRMNSLLGESRRPVGKEELGISQNGPSMKAVSLESGLSSHPQLQRHHVCHIKKPPPSPPKKPSTLARKAKVCALADLTNKVQPKTNVDSSDQSGAQKPLGQQVVEKDMSRYRGSPRNPLNQVRLISATKPIAL
ncbi:LOW QUALITY PROTEIN: rho GTPase-activating protein 11A [Gymnodraco acuticeps]|uniref:LOW QUALITY PROTEIN: rho GTPase-activating protein 11A n=1 Tax=Gymnodraco acuticeps TaxID=8218 RepID=A0A6P8UZS1_GYMAC|nr:LOW QUALITY PROTEIN: rho GTPase-activating protein 11A [Gymnodraco acuticeps]